MRNNYLDFERPLAELDSKIEELKKLEQDANDESAQAELSGESGSNGSSDSSNSGGSDSGVQGVSSAVVQAPGDSGIHLDIADEVDRLQQKSEALAREIYEGLSPWQIAQVARHPRRPYTLDYIQAIFTDFQELKGDRTYADDASIMAGLARLDDQPVMVIGHQKGRTVQEKVKRNFGMPRPEGYRKALRLMKMAERFQVPVLTFIDTPGAYPGIDAEERGQSEAIATNIQEMSALKVPVIATVVGEGGSGGALAIGVCDHLQMLQFSTYSVISPEGCASILWKSAEKASEAAAAMGLTARRLRELKLIDEVIEEPLGGAHRNEELMANRLKQALKDNLTQLLALDLSQLLEKRYQRLMQYSALV